MTIKAQLPLNVLIWSPDNFFSLPNIQVHLNSHLNANVELVSKLKRVDGNTATILKSYRTITRVKYTIRSTKTNRYTDNIGQELLAQRLGDDILKVHNRLIRVLRGKLKAWQASPLVATEDYKFLLPNWKTYYKGEDNKRFKRYTNGPVGLDEFVKAYSDSSALSKTAHFSHADLEEASEWLEENLPITVTEELSAQAAEAHSDNNLRLAIFNYVVALEQSLQQYLSKQLNTKLSEVAEAKDINEFLSSAQMSVKNKLNVLLRLVIHESWLRDIDFAKIELAIKARNKIAHGSTVEVDDRYMGVDWPAVFKNVEALIKALTDATLLIDKDPEIKNITDDFYKKYSTYPTIWLHRHHKMTCEIMLYYGDDRADERLQDMATFLGTQRTTQDRRFIAKDHLIVNFVQFPSNVFAKWKSGKVERMYSPE